MHIWPYIDIYGPIWPYIDFAVFYSLCIGGDSLKYSNCFMNGPHGCLAPLDGLGAKPKTSVTFASSEPPTACHQEAPHRAYRNPYINL